MEKYTLNFYDALKEMLENNAWIKGDNFVPGVYIKVDNQGQIVMVDVSRISSETPYPFIGSMVNQKFRVIKFATVKELSN